MLLNEHKNTKKQGDAGLGDAIAYFTSLGYTVSIPLTDSDDYDIIVDFTDVGLKKIQVKTSTFKRKSYEVLIKTNGGNQSRKTEKKFNGSSVDFLYILTLDGDRYLIPTKGISNKNTITLGVKYNASKVT